MNAAEKKKININQFMIILLITVGVMAVSAFLDENFLRIRNLNNLVINTLPVMIAGAGQMIVLLTAGIDLSLGGIVSMCNVVCVALMNREKPWSVLPAVAVTILVGAAAGAVNGYLVAYQSLPAVIVTIATMSLYDGLALLMRPVPGGSVVKVYARFMMGKYGFPAHIFLLVCMAFAGWYITSGSKTGKKLRAIGGSELAAYSTGINVRRNKLLAYTLAGIFASISALFLVAQMTSADAKIGSTYAMRSITVAVVGGTSLAGAIGKIPGVIVGSFLIMIMNNILNLVGVSSFYQYIFQGGILIVALAISKIASGNR